MDFDIAIAGAGVIGLALAETFSQKGLCVAVVETQPSFGQGISSRNSEVVHAGIYYPKESLKAKLCTTGNPLLYRFCKTRRIPHLCCGKLIVATEPDQEAELDRLNANASACGVSLKRLTSSQVKKMEPRVKASSALFSPTTGIVSAHHLMAALYRTARKQKVIFSFETRVLEARHTGSGNTIRVQYRDGKEESFTSTYFINAAGLYADTLAQRSGLPKDEVATHWWKGEYASLALPQNALKHLIYPVPQKANTGLGIHTTLGIDGTTRLGPNAIYLPEKTEDYRVEPCRLPSFHEAASRYLEGITPTMITPSMVGIRPKRQKPGDPVQDFLIHAISKKAQIHLIGLESPGLTASLALAEHISGLF